MQQQRPAQTSPWAMASLLCSLMIFCPLATVAGPALGVKALADIRARPGYTGQALALSGIIIGVLVTAGWIAAAVWWDRSVRQPILAGPEQELAAAFRGDIESFKAGFQGAGAEASDEQAVAFINELTRRYGRLHSIRQAPGTSDAPAAPDATGDSEQPAEAERATEPDAQPRTIDVAPPIPYILQFDSGEVRADAQFVAFADEGIRFVGKWRSIVIYDDERGDLRYPP